MSNAKILIATPMLGTVNANFLTSMMALQGEGHTQYAVEIGSLVYMARNRLAAKAVDGGFDYILWLDSDMIFPSNVIKALMHDARQGLEYVSGLYFRRRLPTEPVICKDVVWERGEDGVIKHGAEPYMDYPRDSIFEIAGSGLGFCLMKVDIVKEVAKQFMMPPFDPMPALGEDFSFCWRLKKLGVPMYCDSSVKCGHAGEVIFDENTFLNQREVVKES